MGGNPSSAGGIRRCSFTRCHGEGLHLCVMHSGIVPGRETNQKDEKGGRRRSEGRRWGDTPQVGLCDPLEKRGR
jgi:hypothetical protein